MIFLAFFFFPIAVYCLILGALNRRPRAALVRGEWDCLGLLFASAGLLLFGGPALLSAFYHTEVRDFLLGRLRAARVDFADLFEHWWRIWLLYYIVVLAISAILIWWRSGFTAVYNVDPAALDEILGQVLDRLGLEWARMGNRVFVGFQDTRRLPAARSQEGLAASSSEHITAAAIVPKSAGPFPSREDAAILDIEPFVATRHVTLIWRSAAPGLRTAIEAELGTGLAGVPAPENPAGVWFVVAASVLFFLIFLSIAVMLVVEIIARRGG